jgi:hypothetical protein
MRTVLFLTRLHQLHFRKATPEQRTDHLFLFMALLTGDRGLLTIRECFLDFAYVNVFIRHKR